MATRMQYRQFLRIEKLKKTLNAIAYGSLALDVAIAVVTLASFHVYSNELGRIQYFLNVALTVEVIVTIVLVLSMLAVGHYQRMLDNLIRMGELLTGRRRGFDKKR